MMNTLLISIVLAAADQLIKQYIRLQPTGTVLFSIPYAADIVHCSNTGAAFSILSGHTLLLTVFSVVLLAAVTYLLFKRMRLSSAAKAGYAVLLGGGAGNLIDRVLYGCVTDYIRLTFIDFPVFNLADIAITLSAVLLAFLTLTDRLEPHSGEYHESDH